jgi:ABC-2 type transport system permease protein
MNKIVAIAKREISKSLRSPGYYILLAFIVFIQGYEFSLLFIKDGALAIRSLMRESAFLMLIGAPVITAGALAGERSNGELGWFLSQPVSEAEIIGGKSLGGLILLLPLALSTMIPALVAIFMGGLEAAPILTAVGGLFLVAFTCGSAGIFASSFSQKSSTATALSLGILLCTSFLGVIGSRSLIENSIGGGMASAGAFNPFSLADYLFRGIIDSRPIIFFTTATLLFMSLAILSLKSERWLFSGEEGPIGGRQYTRQTLKSVRMALYSLPLLLIFGIIHLANVNCHVSLDMSGYLTLSKSSIELLQNLNQDLLILIVKRTNDFTRTRLDDLIDELVRAGRGKVKKLLWDEKLHFSTLRPLGLVERPDSGIVLKLGNRVTTIPESELYVISRGAERSLFQGIGRLIPDKSDLHIYFVTGHKEVDTSNTLKILNTFGIETSSIILSSEKSIPPVKTALAIIGPQIPFTPSEEELVKNYLYSGGKLILTIDRNFPEAFNPLLNLLPVKSTGKIIEDSTRSIAGGSKTSLIVIPQKEHPVTRITGPIQIVYPESTDVTLVPDREDGLHSILITSGATARFAGETTDSVKSEIHPKSLAVTILGPQAIHPFSACVFGSSDWLSNPVISVYPGQTQFLRGICLWLFERDSGNAIPQGPVEPLMVLSRKESEQLIYGVAAIPAFAILFCGFIAYLQYRKRLAIIIIND